MPKKKEQKPAIRKVIENEFNIDPEGLLGNCLAILGSRDALGRFASFYEKNKVELEILFETLKREVFTIERFRDNEEYERIKRVIGKPLQFFEDCSNEISGIEPGDDPSEDI